MAIRLTSLGTEWVDEEVLFAGDLNDTFAYNSDQMSESYIGIGRNELNLLKVFNDSSLTLDTKNFLDIFSSAEGLLSTVDTEETDSFYNSSEDIYFNFLEPGEVVSKGSGNGSDTGGDRTGFIKSSNDGVNYNITARADARFDNACTVKLYNDDTSELIESQFLSTDSYHEYTFSHICEPNILYRIVFEKHSGDNFYIVDSYDSNNKGYHIYANETVNRNIKTITATSLNTEQVPFNKDIFLNYDKSKPNDVILVPFSSSTDSEEIGDVRFKFIKLVGTEGTFQDSHFSRLDGTPDYEKLKGNVIIPESFTHDYVDVSLSANTTELDEAFIYLTLEGLDGTNYPDGNIYAYYGRYPNVEQPSEHGSYRGFIYGDNGNKCYYIGSNDIVYQYSLSSPYDLKTRSYDSKNFNFGSEDGTMMHGVWSTDGTKFYMIGRATDAVNQYSASTAFDISSLTFDSISFSVNSEESLVTNIRFKPDGTKFYILGGQGDDINEYTLGTAWDISTASYNASSDSFGSSAGDYGFYFTSDGVHLFIGGSDPGLRQYELSTPWDITTVGSSPISSLPSSQFSANTIELDTENNILYAHSTGRYVTFYFQLNSSNELSAVKEVPSLSTRDISTSKEKYRLESAEDINVSSGEYAIVFHLTDRTGVVGTTDYLKVYRCNVSDGDGARFNDDSWESYFDSPFAQLGYKNITEELVSNIIHKNLELTDTPDQLIIHQKDTSVSKIHKFDLFIK